MPLPPAVWQRVVAAFPSDAERWGLGVASRETQQYLKEANSKWARVDLETVVAKCPDVSYLLKHPLTRPETRWEAFLRCPHRRRYENKLLPYRDPPSLNYGAYMAARQGIYVLCAWINSQPDLNMVKMVNTVLGYWNADLVYRLLHPLHSDHPKLEVCHLTSQERLHFRFTYKGDSWSLSRDFSKHAIKAYINDWDNPRTRPGATLILRRLCIHVKQIDTLTHDYAAYLVELFNTPLESKDNLQAACTLRKAHKNSI